jgi:hypothetical protein
MSGFEGAQREDHDEREAGVRLLDGACSMGNVILNSGEAAGGPYVSRKFRSGWWETHSASSGRDPGDCVAAAIAS